MVPKNEDTSGVRAGSSCSSTLWRRDTEMRRGLQVFALKKTWASRGNTNDDERMTGRAHHVRRERARRLPRHPRIRATPSFKTHSSKPEAHRFWDSGRENSS